MSDVINSLDVLFPPFADLVRIYNLKVEEYFFYIFETYRSMERQLERYALGREQKNGVWVVSNSKDIVTRAKPGSSFHTYGLAFDSVPDGDLTKKGIQYDWGTTYKNGGGVVTKVPWSKIGAIGESIGLEWAGNWKGGFTELCHFQKTYGCKASELYQLLTSSGLESVWKFVYTKIPAAKNVVSVTLPPFLVKPAVPVGAPTVTELDAQAVEIASAKNSGSKLSAFLQLLKSIFMGGK